MLTRPWLPYLVYFRCSSSVFTRYMPVSRFHLLRPGASGLALLGSQVPLLKRRPSFLALPRRSEPVSSSAGLPFSLTCSPKIESIRVARGLPDSLSSVAKSLSSSAGLPFSPCRGGPSPSPQAPAFLSRSLARRNGRHNGYFLAETASPSPSPNRRPSGLAPLARSCERVHLQSPAGLPALLAVNGHHPPKLVDCVHSAAG